jgi:hypothetical protein
MFSMGMADNRRFPGLDSWAAHPDSFVVRDVNGIIVASMFCGDGLQKWRKGLCSWAAG